MEINIIKDIKEEKKEFKDKKVYSEEERKQRNKERALQNYYKNKEQILNKYRGNPDKAKYMKEYTSSEEYKAKKIEYNKRYHERVKAKKQEEK